MYLYRLIRFKLAYLRWAFGFPGFRMGDPFLGSGDLRKKNKDILRDRYSAKEPKREDFGLPKARQ